MVEPVVASSRLRTPIPDSLSLQPIVILNSLTTNSLTLSTNKRSTTA